MAAFYRFNYSATEETRIRFERNARNVPFETSVGLVHPETGPVFDEKDSFARTNNELALGELRR